MKLLDKQTIVSLKGKERKQEIDEALKLAKKIDLLRETSAKEEVNLQKFRLASLNKVREEIDRLIEEKNLAQAQVTALEVKRSDLQKPLDAEWDRVKEEEQRLINFSLELNNKYLEIQDDSKNNQVEKELIETEKERIESERKRSIKYIAESSEILEDARKEYTKAQRQVVESNEYFEKKNSELLTREAQIAVNEREIEINRKDITEKRKEIAVEKIQLRDQRATLERAINRLKKK